MICPICGRLMSSLVTHWNECEELREYDPDVLFCPCCGWMGRIIQEANHV
uniref:Uncharacterized protein n=1 Tax=viral metagenome TaxID=1070528 RepID=A0A6M3JWZ4_9ZZZZ